MVTVEKWLVGNNSGSLKPGRRLVQAHNDRIVDQGRARGSGVKWSQSRGLY